jgi:hypothetical protein
MVSSLLQLGLDHRATSSPLEVKECRAAPIFLYASLIDILAADV